MKKKTTKGPKVPGVQSTYETEIEFTCPVRGKVKQKVKVKRLESVEQSTITEILPSKSVSDKLDLQYSGLILEDDSLEDEGETL